MVRKEIFDDLIEVTVGLVEELADVAENGPTDENRVNEIRRDLYNLTGCFVDIGIHPAITDRLKKSFHELATIAEQRSQQGADIRDIMQDIEESLMAVTEDYDRRYERIPDTIDDVKCRMDIREKTSKTEAVRKTEAFLRPMETERIRRGEEYNLAYALGLWA